MRATKRFSEKAIERLRAEIKEAGGNEVFALGYFDGIYSDGDGSDSDSKLIARIEISARGNEGAVPAVHDRLASADVLIHNHPSGFLTPSDNDLAIACRAAEAGVGCYIVDNPVENVYVVAEPVKRRKVSRLDPKAISASLEPGGAISRRLPSYEIRESQLELMRLIIRGFNDDALVAAEAGTGVGKSFAYLLPALSFAVANDERIVISTATITLQEQLYGKDIPLVTAGLGKKIKTVLVKGRGNYLCRRRLDDALRESYLFDEEKGHLEDIARWAETSATGSVSDLSFLPVEGLWSRVCSEADTCMSMRCPERERCFVMLLRRDASDARVLVVNHHLLFADLAARHEGAGYSGAVVLPPYSRVIIDEAHKTEESATSFFSQEFSRLGIYRQLGRLYRKRRGSKSGLLLRLISMLPGKAEKAEDQDQIDDRIEEAIETIRNAVDNLDETALALCAGEGVFRLTPQKEGIVKDGLLPEFAALRKTLNSLAGLVRNLLEEVPEESGDDSAVWEVRAVLRRLDTVGSVCTCFIEYMEKSDEVMWMEKRARGEPRSGQTSVEGSGSRREIRGEIRGQIAGDLPWVVFNVTPIDIAPSLKEALFEPSKTVVCVSATLTTGTSAEGSFDYWKNGCGLNLLGEREVLTGIFPSPFPFQSRVLLAAPSDAPLPADEEYGVFVDTAVAALTEAAGGSALVLFTSYRALKSAYEAAQPVLQKQGIRLLRQGDDDRNRLLQSFLNDENSVLFATDSFWEGVDAPGDTLRLVILCRLPFRSPNDPVFEARRDALKSRGGNAFMDLSLPEAVMKLKQGFGRLMRRSSDHGVVVVLDGRLLRKSYGGIFLASLPETKTCFGSLDTILRSMENFLF
ncbi:MAG: ATP-dependent DNA helicase DinG [Treponema sp.]|nr:ATP-dependent DNA helicase DinG [Treponema sp.]